MSKEKDIELQETLLGHPTGLYTLFFAEMWERFSYYGMRALLVFYMIKGFLGYGDSQAYAVYGAYTALVYMTPFIGGMLADKILGKRIAVVIGGVLMAAGHLLMTVESEWPFFFALALLITGNGFFKPNISTTVGSLYAAGDKRRDDGFNIFYTGINMGAAMSPLLCGFIGETYGWHYGFGLATIGMLIGLAVFVMPNIVSQLLIFSGALASAIGLLVFRPDNIYAILINIFVAVCLMIAAVVACMALGRGGLPKWAGARPDGVDGRHDWKIYLGIAIAIPVFALLVSGFSPFTSPPEGAKVKTKAELLDERIEFLEKFEVDEDIIAKVKANGINVEPKLRGVPYQMIPAETIDNVKGISDSRVNKVITEVLSIEKDDIGDDSFASLSASQKSSLKAGLEKEFGIEFADGELGDMESPKSLIKAVNKKRESFAGAILGLFLEEVSKPAGLVLTILGILAFGYLIIETFKLQKIPRERMLAALILIFFQMLFFAFFEQAGSSINNFTDRNIDRVAEVETVENGMVGTSIRIQPTQAQLGFKRGTGDNPEVFTLSDLDELRKIVKETPDVDQIEIGWQVNQGNVGMGIANQLAELPATIFQSFNAIFILIFALLFNLMWSALRKMRLDPSAPVKFGLGLIQLGLGFGAFWMGAKYANDQGMVSITWLTLGILLHTTGELCLSPVGLSTMTKLSPKALVSTLMGAWFLATAFSQYLAGVISQFTSVDSVEGFPPPTETVNVYGGVFGQIAVVAMICGGVCILLSPLLTYWMHSKADYTEKDE